MRERREYRTSLSDKDKQFVDAVKEELRKTTPEPTVRVRTKETHDGDACACVDKEMTLRVGDTIELEHVCHDGRVDKVFAEILSIDVPKPAVEHGKVTGPA